MRRAHGTLSSCVLRPGAGVPASDLKAGAWPPTPSPPSGPTVPPAHDALAGGQNHASGALAVFDAGDAAPGARKTVVLSTFSSFTSTMMVHNTSRRVVAFGVSGRVASVPAGMYAVAAETGVDTMPS